MKIQKLLLTFSCLILLITAVLKIEILNSQLPLLQEIDNVTGLTYNSTILIAVLVELSLFLICISKIDYIYKGWSLLLFSLITSAYKLIGSVFYKQEFCGCLGRFEDIFKLTPKQYLFLTWLLLIFLLTSGIANLSKSKKNLIC